MSYANMAQHVQSRGRGDDSVLIHMTPKEVGGLQALALRSGGSLTTNPDTGLLEAGWLGDLLPTILGIAGAAFGLPTWALGLGGLAGGTIASGGDIGKGIAAGLQAFGGGALGGAMGLGGSLGNIGQTLGLSGAQAAGAAGGAGANVANEFGHLADVAATPMNAIPAAAPGASFADAFAPFAQGAGQAGASSALSPLAHEAAHVAATAASPGGVGGFLGRFGAAAKEGLPAGILQKIAPMAAGTGVMSAINDVTAPNLPKYDENAASGADFYNGPYSMAPRHPVYPGPDRDPKDTSEWNFFPQPPQLLDVENRPYTPGQRYAMGGTVDPMAQMQGSPTAFNTNTPVNQMPTPAQAPVSISLMPPQPSDQTNNANGLGEIKGLPALAGGGAVAAPTIRAMAMHPMFNVSRTMPMPAPASVAPGRVNGPGFTPGMFANRPANTTMLDALARARAAPVVPPAHPVPVSGGLGAGQPPFVPAQPISPFPTAPIGAPVLPGPADPNVLGPVSPSIQSTPLGPVMTPSGGFTAPPPIPTDPGFDPLLEDPDPVRPARPVRPGNFAVGGAVPLQDGSFVVDARTVAELGNGSSDAGQELLARLGGTPIGGIGDGASDSIPASVDGEQGARVARDEVLFSPQAVAQLGGGDPKKGTQLLYDLMKRAEKARKSAKRGGDNKIAKGLAAL